MAAYIITGPQTYESYDAAGRSTIRGLEKIMSASVDTIEDFVSKFFKPKTFSPKKVTSMVTSGFSQGKAWDMKSIIPVATKAYLYDIVAEQFGFGNSMGVTLEQNTWDLYDIDKEDSKKLGTSIASLYQKTNMLFWSYAWTASALCQWYNCETVAFFSASHAWAKNVPADITAALGSYRSNLGGGALTMTNLLDACAKLWDHRDALGQPDKRRPETLFVENTKVTAARELLNQGQMLKSGEFSNNRNPFQNEYSGITVEGVPLPYLPTLNTWILKGDKTETYVSDHVPITIESFPKQRDHTVYTDAWFVTCPYAEDWGGWVGWTG